MRDSVITVLPENTEKSVITSDDVGFALAAYPKFQNCSFAALKFIFQVVSHINYVICIKI